MLLESGQVVEHRYEVIRLLGEGAMGQVYEVTHRALKRRFALKIFAPELVRDDALRSRCLAEGQIQANLRHPNIAEVTDVVVEPHAGLVIEFIDGPSLHEYLETQGGPLPEDEILAIAMPVLGAVAAAHDAGIVHRDLKPANILLGRDAEGGLRPVVADFGIAKVLQSSTLEAGHRTQTGTFLGTPEYMSPEQVLCNDEIDQRADIFALGAILYEMATGRVAFAAPSVFEAQTRIVKGEYEAPDRVVEGLHPTLATCIRGALTPDRDRRFPTVKALRFALEAVSGPGTRGGAHNPVPRQPVPPPTPAPEPAPAPPVVSAPPSAAAPSRVPVVASATMQFEIWVGGQAIEIVETPDENITIGGGPASILQIDDPTLADMHCAVTTDEDGNTMLLDFTAAGTRLNGQPCNQGPISSGDVIEIGHSRLVFRRA